MCHLCKCIRITKLKRPITRPREWVDDVLLLFLILAQANYPFVDNIQFGMGACACASPNALPLPHIHYHFGSDPSVLSRNRALLLFFSHLTLIHWWWWNFDDILSVIVWCLGWVNLYIHLNWAHRYMRNIIIAILYVIVTNLVWHGFDLYNQFALSFSQKISHRWYARACARAHPHTYAHAHAYAFGRTFHWN